MDQVKLSKLPRLKALYEAKEAAQMKLSRRITSASTTKDVAQWLGSFSDLQKFKSLFADINGERLLKMDSDDALERIGIPYEIDRGRLIIQIRRARQAGRKKANTDSSRNSFPRTTAVPLGSI